MSKFPLGQSDDDRVAFDEGSQIWQRTSGSGGAGDIKFSADTVQDLEALTSVEGVVVGSIGLVLATGNLYRATAATVASSSWEPSTNLWNVRDFGAVGDDATDDTSAFADCLSSMEAVEPSGGVYFIPPGSYRLSSFPEPVGGGGGGTHNAVIFRGCGSRRNGDNDLPPTRLVYTGAGVAWELINQTGLVIENLVVDAVGGFTGKTGIRMAGCQSCKIDHVSVMGGDVTGVGNGLSIGLDLDSTDQQSCIYNQFSSFSATLMQDGGDGVGVLLRETGANSTNNNLFENLICGNCDTGLEQLDSPNENVFVGLEVSGGTTGAVVRGRNTVFHGANIEGLTTGISLPSAGASLSLSGVHFDGNTTDVSNGSGSEVRRDLGTYSNQSGLASLTPDPSVSRIYRIVLTQDIDIENPVNDWDGAEFTLMFQQNNPGGHAINFVGSDYRENAAPSGVAFQWNCYLFVRANNLWVNVAKEEGVA